jgi:SAM-dependent methyltransferase
MGAVPAAPVVDPTPGAVATRPPPPPAAPDDSPFSDDAVEPDQAARDVDGEAAALAAEAAAVRALDVGPMTPPPEFVPSAAPGVAGGEVALTPPPEVVPVASAESVEIAAPTPPPEVVSTAPRTPTPRTRARTPSPEPLAGVHTPPPDVSAGPHTPPPETVRARTPQPEFPTVVRTPSPDLLEASRTPTPQMSADGAPHTPPPELDFDDQPTPPPQIGSAPRSPAAHDVAALPAEALTDSNSEQIADTADAANLDASVTEQEFDGDDVEVMDGTEQARALEFADGAGESPQVARIATPPPIPGSYFRTPPEALKGDAAGVGIAGLPILPEPLAQRPRRPKRSKPWFEEVFDEDYLRTLPFMSADQTLREVEFISEALRVGNGAEILDVACGYGRHAIELVQRGFNVTGLDLSLPLLIRAADEAQRRALSVNFVHADMREMAFEKQFDGAYSMLTSFGYFDEDTNLRVAERIGRALKPGARFLLDIVNRDYVVADLPMRVWWEGTGCVVLEEVDFNFHTSRIVTHRSIVFEDGRQLEQELSVRAYSLHEIGRLLRQAGFRVMDVSGGLATRGQFFGASSRSLLIVAEKRESDTAQPL